MMRFQKKLYLLVFRCIITTYNASCLIVEIKIYT